MLAKELKVAQMQDATDAQNDDSRPSLRSIVLQSLLTAPVKALAYKIGSKAPMLPSRVSCDISALLPLQRHGVSAPVSGYAASAVISHDLLHMPCHTRNSFLGSLPGCSAGRTPSYGKINNELKRQLTLSLTRRGGDNRPMRIMICAESFATSVSEALSFIQGLSHPNCMQDDSVNTSTPAKAAVMKSVSVVPAQNTT